MLDLMNSFTKGLNYGKQKTAERVSKLEDWRRQQEMAYIENDVDKSNELRRGIIEYSTFYIENIANEPMYSIPTIIAGGSETMRAQNISVLIWEAQTQGLPVLVLHNNDIELESILPNYFSKICIINQWNPIYDPFYKMNSFEISDAILYSAPKDSLKDDVIYLISGISEYLSLKQATPTSAILVDAPVIDLYDRINNSAIQGALSSQAIQPILNKLVQGQSQSASLMNYFNKLRMYGKGLMKLTHQGNKGANIKTTAQTGGILTLNMGSVPHSIVQDLVLYELLQVLSTGKQMLIVLDGVNINSNDKLKQIAISGFSGAPTVWAGNDIFGLMGGSEDIFHNIIGGAQRYLFYKQPNAVTATKCAEILGQYEHLSFDRSYASGSSGISSNVSVSRSQQYRIDPQSLLNLSSQSGYFYNPLKSKLITHAEEFVLASDVT